MLFATDDNPSHLSTIDIIYVDGTFQICPSLFTHEWFSAWAAISTLLPPKSHNDYNRLFREEMQNLGFWLEPDRVMADFKISLVQLLCLRTSIKG